MKQRVASAEVAASNPVGASRIQHERVASSSSPVQFDGRAVPLHPPTERRPVATASAGVARAELPLPHLDRIQHAFGNYDVTHVRVAVGGPSQVAARELGARAFTVGDRIGFRSPPDLRLAAHEAAHVVQQGSGVALEAEVGTRGDAFERNADAVADAVVRGDSAQPILDSVAKGRCSCGGTCAGCGSAVQLQEADDTEEETEQTQEVLPPWPSATSLSGISPDEICGGKCYDDADLEAYLKPSLLYERASKWGPVERWKNPKLCGDDCFGSGTTFDEWFDNGVQSRWFYRDEKEALELGLGRKERRERRAKQAKVEAEIQQHNAWVAQGENMRNFANSPGLVGWYACRAAGKDFDESMECGDLVNAGATVAGLGHGTFRGRQGKRSTTTTTPTTTTPITTTVTTTTKPTTTTTVTTTTKPTTAKPATTTSPATKPATKKPAAKKPVAQKPAKQSQDAPLAKPNKKPDDPRSPEEAEQDQVQVNRYKKPKNRKRFSTFKEWWEAEGKKWYPNRYGSKGRPDDHQPTVKRLVKMAESEFPNDIIHSEKVSINGKRTVSGKVIRRVKRKPDVWVEDAMNRNVVKKIYEAARTNDDGTFVPRELEKKKQYDGLGIKNHFEPVRPDPEPSDPRKPDLDPQGE